MTPPLSLPQVTSGAYLMSSYSPPPPLCPPLPPLPLPQVTSGAYVVILNSVFVGEWGPQGGGLTV